MYGFTFIGSESADLTATALQINFSYEANLFYFFSTDAKLLEQVSFFFLFALFNLFSTVAFFYFSIKSNDEFSCYLQVLHLFALFFCPFTQAAFSYILIY
jgi:hypothetical protein